MDVSPFANHENKFVRQAYQRRQEEIQFFNMSKRRADEARQQAEASARRIGILVKHLLVAGNTVADIATMIGLSEQEMLTLLPELA